ncbi:MAG TPA: hypothetical protein VJ761_02820 [Ktedonobacteraceae bacterium]|nr:hypothetical protein [Ktedonobacteraceae bacterium]
MRRKKHLQDMSRDELIQFGQKLEEQRQWWNARRREWRLWLKPAPCEKTFSMLYEGLGDDAPNAIIYAMLVDEPAIYMLGRCEQKGCRV